MQLIFNFNSETHNYTAFGVPMSFDRTLEFWGVSIIIIASTNTAQFPGVVLDPDKVEINNIIGMFATSDDHLHLMILAY